MCQGSQVIKKTSSLTGDRLFCKEAKRRGNPCSFMVETDGKKLHTCNPYARELMSFRDMFFDMRDIPLNR